MRDTTRIIRKCDEENPRATAINKAVEESELGFPMNCRNYPSLIGKTAVIAWTKTREGKIVERGEEVGTIVGLSAYDHMNDHITVVLGMACMNPGFRCFVYRSDKKCWVPHFTETPSGDQSLVGISVQINLA